MLAEISRLLDLLANEGLLKDRALVGVLCKWIVTVQDEIDRDCISGELGIRIARVGMLDEGESLAREISSVHERPQYMRQVAEAETEAGESTRAVSLLREAIMAIQRMPANWYWEKAEVLAYIARALYHAGEHSAAVEQWEKAIEIARAGENSDPNAIDCSAVLWTISRMLGEIGNTERAREVASGIRDEQRRHGALGQLNRPRH